MNAYFKRISLTFCLLIFVFLIGCQSTGLKIGSLDVGKLVNQGIAVWDVSSIDDEKELQFGANMSAVLLGTRPLHPNKHLNEYVNKVGYWLASNSDKPELPWKFGVINSSAINAFAAPGGYVFITSGMFEQLENEAQLAAVLAHEIIHVVEQHHLNAIKSNVYSEAVTQALFVSAEAYQENTGADQKEREHSMWAKKITGAAQDLYSKGLDRTDEYQADEYGIRLLAKSGYDPFAFVHNLQVLAAISPDDSSLALMYKTHPTPEERITSISEQLKLLSSYEGKLLASRFQRHFQ